MYSEVTELSDICGPFQGEAWLHLHSPVKSPSNTFYHSLLSTDHTDPLADTLVPSRLSSCHPEISSLVKTRGTTLCKQDLVTCLCASLVAWVPAWFVPQGE